MSSKLNGWKYDVMKFASESHERIEINGVGVPGVSTRTRSTSRLPTGDTRLRHSAQLRRPNTRLRVVRSPRIGLDISHPTIPSPSSSPAAALAHPRVTFIARHYRFFVSPYVLTANGRGQTFVGVHDALVTRGHCTTDAEVLGELVRLTGFKGPTTAKYLAELRDGLADGTLGEWTGPKGKSVTSSVMAWLRMIGTLRRLGARSKEGRAETQGAAA
ncbi:hypothetical protein V8D89_003926 [Ganoderma adspersum]